MKNGKENIILWKRSCLLTHPLNEASIVKAPSRHIGVKFLQGIGETGILSILEKSISIHPLRINFLHTICSQI